MKKKVIITTIIIIILLGYYLYFQNTELQVSSYDIVDSRIPKKFNKYKIVQVSDFHNTKSNKLINDLVKEIKKQKPNVIVITGDLVDSRKTDIDVSINFIKRIKDIAPIYFITGNHEASISEYENLKVKLEKESVIILDNKTKVLEVADSKINLIGVNDPSMSYHPEATDSEKIKSELTESNYDKNSYSILLSHRPELFNTYVDNEIDLVLTGHAHGGQIGIPFIGGLVAPNQGLFPEYTSGTFKEENTSMIISRGIGNSIIPFRINNRPELVIVELKNK
ncbi:MAG: metallophosphoesterase [Bacilli bacterium]